MELTGGRQREDAGEWKGGKEERVQGNGMMEE